MSSKPEITVILPVRNGEKTVARALDSLLAQSFRDYEVIAVDDGSTDGTGGILDVYRENDSRIRVFHTENRGVSEARNTGLREARGSYITFLDCDDVTKDSWLLSLYTGIRSGKYGMAVCGYAAGREGEKPVSAAFEQRILTSDEALGRMLRYRDLTSAVWNKMLKADVIAENGILFSPRYSIGEDLVFLTRYCMYIDSVIVVPDTAYVYTTGNESAMGEYGRGSVFKENWISEWYAVRETERILFSSGKRMRELEIKKTRIAGKLLLAMADYGYRDPNLERDLTDTLRKNIGIILTEKEFGSRRRIGMIIAAVSPGLSAFIRRTEWKLRKKK